MKFTDNDNDLLWSVDNGYKNCNKMGKIPNQVKNDKTKGYENLAQCPFSSVCWQSV